MHIELGKLNRINQRRFDMALREVKSKKGSKRRDGKRQSRRQNGNTALPTLERIAVEDVEVISKHRDVDPEKVKSLAASMAKIGLRTPITVRRIKKGLGRVLALVAGVHRLEAARTLGWEHIDAFIMEGNDNDARIWQLMENVCRADLTPLQRAEHVAELVQFVRDSEKGGQVAPPGGQQPYERGIKKAAKALGFSREEVRRSLDIAAISEEAKEKAKEKDLDKNQSALLKIAKEQGSEAQIAKIEEINSGKTSGSNISAPGKVKPKKKKLLKPPTEDTSDTDEINEVDSPPLAPDSNEDSDSDSQGSEEIDKVDDDSEKDRLFSELKAAWDAAPPSVRKRFIKKVLHLDLNGIGEEIWTA
jgi:ParB-like chromosome segregation protein Spo0J